MKPKQLSDIFALVRERRPLVHHITNYVTVNDCANITLCAGGAPVMADAPEEVEEMAAVAGALVLNIGTLNKAQIESMLLAGRMAHVGQLLGEFAGGEEVDAGFAEGVRDYDRQEFFVCCNGFGHDPFPLPNL